MFGVPDGALAPGMNYGELVDVVVAAGQVTAEDMQGVRERRAELIKRNERAIAMSNRFQFRPPFRVQS
jgi:hypothetical protein